jgi:2-desacetyl-2-hydroxyethyl bacteriochlorophyllide A dehydrogenase
MKAIVYTKYGSPDVLNLREVEKPAPKDHEVLVKVHAASANPADWHLIRGRPAFARLSMGLFKPKNTIPGLDVAGQIEATGSNVTEFKPGDEVFGSCGWGGGFAEFVCVIEKNLVIKPAHLTFEEAAAVNVAALTALQGLRPEGMIKSGQKVLINGASGGVGTFAVQIAKWLGAEVTGVCSTRNLEMVQSIGADHVIDYTKEDFTRNEQKYDFILDTIGNRSVVDYKRALNEKGNCVIVGFTSLGRLFEHMLLGPLGSSAGGKKVGLMGTAQTNKKDLTILKELLESGKIKPVIDRKYSLSEAAEAIRYLEKGHARGKVVIRVSKG